MTRWGLYDKVCPAHVFPVDEKNMAIGGHLTSQTCWCIPRKVMYNGQRVVWHQDKGTGRTVPADTTPEVQE